MDLLILLGAGASVDSGLPTYRGREDGSYFVPISCYDGYSKMWDHFKYLYECVKDCKPGVTYDLLSELLNKYPKSNILTQNVDGYALSLPTQVIELHGNINTMYCMKCEVETSTDPDNLTCKSCNGKMRPNVILLDEALDRNVIMKAKNICKQNYKHVLIIGTTLQFPYLRQLISLAKGRGSKVIHINPDPHYNDTQISEISNYSTLGKKLKSEHNVRKKEIWIQKTSSEGIQDFINNY